jgi:hypothetical protein
MNNGTGMTVEYSALMTCWQSSPLQMVTLLPVGLLWPSGSDFHVIFTAGSAS